MYKFKVKKNSYTNSVELCTPENRSPSQFCFFRKIFTPGYFRETILTTLQQFFSRPILAFFLCLIAQCTVYFKQEHFKTSIPVTLTSMLGKIFIRYILIFTPHSSSVHPVCKGSPVAAQHLIHQNYRDLASLPPHHSLLHLLHHLLARAQSSFQNSCFSKTSYSQSKKYYSWNRK